MMTSHRAFCHGLWVNKESILLRIALSSAYFKWTERGEMKQGFYPVHHLHGCLHVLENGLCLPWARDKMI